jgi:hypothetical protein
VLAIVGIMRIGGILRREKSKFDKRILHLGPTPKFIAIVEGWNHLILKIIDAVFPTDKLAEKHASISRSGWDMRRRSAEKVIGGWKLLGPFSEVFHLVSRDGGWMLLLHCFAKTMRRGGGAKIALSVLIRRRLANASAIRIRISDVY